MWGISFLAAGVVASAAYRFNALDRSGALAAVLVGGIVTSAGGWRWGTLLIVFFISSSLLSQLTGRLRPGQHRNVVRGSHRDAWQVFANGGIATLLAAAYFVTEEAILAGAFAASLAAAAADTWATEIGAFSRRPPRLITSLAVVPRGVSGGVSLLGTAATVAGAVTIALCAAFILEEAGLSPIIVFLAVGIGGMAGSLIDSLLGATLQVHYRCPRCDEMTERPVHRCGAVAMRERGFSIFTNDTVNLAAIAAGTLIGGIVGWLLAFA